MRKTVMVAFCLVGLMAGCSDPRNIPIRGAQADLSEHKESLQKLSDEEKNLLAAFMMRRAFNQALDKNAAPAPDTTVGAAIAQQRAYAAEKAQEAAKEKALQEQKAATRQAQMEQMRQAVQVRLVSKQVGEERGYSGMVVDRTLNVAFDITNKSDITVTAIKGRVVARDLFDEEITAFAIKVEETIVPGKTYTWRGSRSLKYSIGTQERDTRFAGLGSDKYKVEWQPEGLVFAGGKTMRAEP